jgi:PilZ domain
VKRLVELTIEDLSAHPVWRYEGGSGAQASASPSDRRTLSQMDDEVFLAATEYELFDASKHRGFCFPADGSGVDYLQPVILSPSGPVSFWFETTPTPETLAGQWKALGREPKDIFPIAYQCLVPVDGQTLSGRIDGVASPEEAAAPKLGDGNPPPPPKRRGIGVSATRTTRRRPAEMTVEFSQGTLYGTGVTGDVSRRGMFVRSPWIPGTGPVLRLTVKLPGGRKLALTGRVVRTVDPAAPARTAPGFGLRLTDDWPGWDELFGKRNHKK